ncbi:hypothetical protein C0992_008863 [Termitomyces sp. T32_za158]|nr:hypothetical protein C0992_008863 [Termitomyces sp. T32_za158]
MVLPSVLFFDAQFLMEGSPVSSTPTIFSSASSDTSICSSDISTAASTLAGDVYTTEKPLDTLQELQHDERRYVTAQVQPTRPTHAIQNDTHIVSAPTAESCRTRSDSLLEQALLPRPLHVPALPCPESRVQESGVQWPYGIDPLSLNKDLPELPKERKRVWRSIRRSVSHLFQRHQPKETLRPALHIVSGRAPPLRDALQPPNSAPLRPSSASVISPLPRISSSSPQALPGVTTHMVGAEPSLACIQEQQLRRSRSFSGYPNAFSGIADERRRPIDSEPTKECDIDWLAFDDDRPLEEDSEMDEVAVEAFEILREVCKTWNFAPINEDDPSFQDPDVLYEGGVERR